MRPYALVYLYTVTGVFAVVLVVSAFFGQIPTGLIYGSGLLTVATVVTAIVAQEDGRR